jgi:hypothetical protein
VKYFGLIAIILGDQKVFDLELMHQEFDKRCVKFSAENMTVPQEFFCPSSKVNAFIEKHNLNVTFIASWFIHPNLWRI